METNAVVQLIMDYKHNTVKGDFSKKDNKEAIRLALIEANGGNPKLTLKSIRDGSSNGLFAIIEQMVDATMAEGLQGNEFVNAMVDSQTVTEGDSVDFVVDGNSTLIVSDISRGTQSIRRQRILDKTTVNVKPIPHAVKIYEELARIMAGKVDITNLSDAIDKAVAKFLLDEIYVAFAAITAADTGALFYPTAGTYDEDEVIALAEMVSAANNGAKAMIVCTLAGARQLVTGTVSEAAKQSVYDNGYALNWNGIPVTIVPQRFAAGGATFIFDDDKIYILAQGTENKPIKQVIGGESTIITGNPLSEADLTQELAIILNSVAAIVVGNKFGVYEIS
jgi:hypothetical protein